MRQFSSYRPFVRRPPNIRFHPKYILPTVRHTMSLMVWGCMSFNGRRAMHLLEKETTMNSFRYLSVLQDKILTLMSVHGTNIFMQDSAPYHKAKIVTEWLADSKIQALDWPGNSPDLNPIENLCRILKQKVSLKKFNNFRGLQNATIQAWATEITKNLCEKIVSSMPSRIKSVLKSNGGHCKY